jgi:hypothetical protein
MSDHAVPQRPSKLFCDDAGRWTTAGCQSLISSTDRYTLTSRGQNKGIAGDVINNISQNSPETEFPQLIMHAKLMNANKQKYSPVELFILILWWR